MTLIEKLIDIQVNLKSKKTRFNKFGGYHFRSAEDILEACKPFLDKHKVCITIRESIILESAYPILKSTATIIDGNDSISAVAIVGIDENQKGMQMPQKFGSASSYAKKYALGNLLLLDDTQDSDAINKHGKSEKETIEDRINKSIKNAKDVPTLCRIENQLDERGLLSKWETIIEEAKSKIIEKEI